jgi:hypothetical protein
VVDINLATFQDTPVQEDFSLLSIGGGVEAEQRIQQGFETNTGIAWGLQTAEEAALRGLQALGRDDKMLTADEANKVYGVEGKLSFNEAMPESVAKLRYNKHINYEARSEILSQAEQDNKGLEWFMQGLAGNVPAIAEAGFGFAVVSGAAPFLIKAAQLAKYGAAGEAIEAALISPFAFGSGATTGIVRGAVGEGAYETLLQVGIKAQADRNGYDYDILWGLASIALGSAGGGLGGFFLGKQADDIASTVKNFETALDDLVESGVITRDGQASIMSKMMSDINSGVITDPKTVNAALRVDYGTALRSKMDNLFESGYLDGIISKAQLDKLDDVKLQKVANTLKFKAYLKQQAGVESQAFVQYLDDIETKISNLETQKVLNADNPRVVEIIQKKIDEALDEKNAINATRNQEFNRIIQAVLRETAEEGFTKAVRTGEDFIPVTAREVSDLTFDEFLKEYKLAANNVRTKKIKTLSNFLKMHRKTQVNIAKLFRLIDPVENNFNFQDLLKLTDDELKAAYTKQLHGRQILNSSSLEEAQGILKGTFKQADETFNEAVAQLGKETEEMQKVVSSLENKDLDGILKDMNIPEEELAAFKAEIESSAEYQDILKTDSKYQGMAEAARCVLGGL